MNDITQIENPIEENLDLKEENVFKDKKEQQKENKRNYQREYMRQRRQNQKKSNEQTVENNLKEIIVNEESKENTKLNPLKYKVVKK